MYEKDLVVKAIALEDIFDEFNGGIRSAQAIKDFLSYAFHNWQEPAFQYVNLLGDGYRDERSSSYKKKFSIIPIKMRWTYGIGATVDDNWYSCVVGDDELPDFAISRTPVWEKEQVAPVLEKTIYYNNNHNYGDLWRNHCLLIAGGGDIFEEQTERLADEYFPDSYRISKIYAQRPSSDPYWGGTTDLKDNLDDGTAFLQFFGHGGGQIWSDLNLLALADIATLFNDNYPIISSMTCYTSNFAYSEETGCLGEAFIIEPEKGAIGFFGGAGKGFKYQDEYFSEFLLNNLSNRKVTNFAKAMNISKIEYYLNYGLSSYTITFIRGFNYLGDPAIDIAFPQKALDVSLNKNEVIKGDTVNILLNNEDSTLNRVAYYVTDENRLIPSSINPNQLEQIEFYEINRTNYDSSGYEYVTDSTVTADAYSRIVHGYAYDDTSDYMGYSMFTVGKSDVFDFQTDPSPPCIGDSISISVKICAQENIDSINCIWWSNEKFPETISLENIADITYQTTDKIEAFAYQTDIYYQFDWVDSLGEHRVKNISENFNSWQTNPTYGRYSYETGYGTWITGHGMCLDDKSRRMTIHRDKSYDGKSMKISNKTYAYLQTPSFAEVGNLSFVYMINSSEINNNYNLRPNYALQYRVSAEDSWITLSIFNPSTYTTEYHKFNYCLNKSGNIQIRIKQINAETKFVKSSGFYLDEFWVSDLDYNSFQLKGPDIDLIGFENTIHDHTSCFAITLRNEGQISFPFNNPNQDTYKIGVYEEADIISSKQLSETIEPTQTRTFYLPYSLSPGIYHLTAKANPDTTFPELFYYNNSEEMDFYLNNFIVKPDTLTTHPSLDNCCQVTFSAGTVSEDTYFYFNQVEVEDVINQPDISQVLLADEQTGCFEIAPFDSTSLDVQGNFHKDIRLQFNYSQVDSSTQALAEEGNYKIFRYNSNINCWILQGGNAKLDENYVSFNFIERPGIYSLFQNSDSNPPTINVNVEGQEFTDGDYVDAEAVFSFVMQDVSGINIDDIVLYLDGQEISDFILSRENIKAVPLKYQVDVDEGTHTFFVSTTDNTGNYRERIVNFSVQKEFNIIHIGNYPNPVSSKTSDLNNEGRTRFTYTLTTGADDVIIKIYTVSGRLVNKLDNLSTACGYHEYPRAMKGWDCRDFDDRKLANGVYFYKVIAKKGKNTIEKIKKMAILR